MLKLRWWVLHDLIYSVCFPRREGIIKYEHICHPSNIKTRSCVFVVNSSQMISTIANSKSFKLIPMSNQLFMLDAWEVHSCIVVSSSSFLMFSNFYQVDLRSITYIIRILLRSIGLTNGLKIGPPLIWLWLSKVHICGFSQVNKLTHVLPIVFTVGSEVSLSNLKM